MEKLEYRKAASLKPYKFNARKHSDDQIEQLRASIREFGFVAPIIIDSDGEIIAGHGRVAAAMKEGIKDVPCVICDTLTEEQRRAYIIADNRLAEAASWDAELLSHELEQLQEAGFDLLLTGFDENYILEDIPVMMSDRPGDGGGSMVSTGTKLRISIGEYISDIPDDDHSLYEITRNLTPQRINQKIVELLRGLDK